jgi:signal transduction histidine kinase
VLDGVSDAFTVSAAANQAGFTCSVAAASPSRVLGDEARLSQILIHLIDKAIKRCDRGGVSLGTRARHPESN